MTSEQIDALEAGPETDKLVAEAIGGKLGHYHDPYDQDNIDADMMVQCLAENGAVAYHKFYPSRDWNSAMFAAEKHNLLQRLSLIRNNVNGVHSYVLFTWNQQTIAYDKSGPLAVCRAILKLARSTQTLSRQQP